MTRLARDSGGAGLGWLGEYIRSSLASQRPPWRWIGTKLDQPSRSVATHEPHRRDPRPERALGRADLEDHVTAAQHLERRSGAAREPPPEQPGAHDRDED